MQEEGGEQLSEHSSHGSTEKIEKSPSQKDQAFMLELEENANVFRTRQLEMMDNYNEENFVREVMSNNIKPL